MFSSLRHPRAGIGTPDGGFFSPKEILRRAGFVLPESVVYLRKPTTDVDGRCKNAGAR